MTVFEFDGKKLPLLFTLEAWERMEAEVCTLDELFEMCRQHTRVETIQKIIQVAVILSRAADAQPPTSYDELHKLSPGMAFVLQGAVMAAVTEGLDFEGNKKSGPRDLVLEELDKQEGKNA